MVKHIIVCCFVLTIASLYGNQVDAVTATTQGTGGPSCPPSSKCLADGQATCDNGVCKCIPPSRGLGYHVCHRQKEIYCAAFNDPTIKGWDGGITNAQLSCKFFLTELKIPICDTSNPLSVVTQPSKGFCHIVVKAWGTRRLGKTFIKGSDLSFVINYNGETYNHLIRIWTTANSGVYKFWQQTNGGPPSDLTIPGAGRIYTEYNPRGDNYGTIIAEMCGFEFGIRGVDLDNPPREQSLSAGVYMKVNTECNPEFPNSAKMLCGAPTGQGTSVSDHAKSLAQETGREVSDDMALMHLVLTDPEPQEFPGAATNLPQLMNTARQCAQSTTSVFLHSLDKCMFVMNDVSFLRCYDETDNLETAIGTIEQCISSICSSNVVRCGEVQQAVLASTCKIRNAPDTIMGASCGGNFNVDDINRP